MKNKEGLQNVLNFGQENEGSQRKVPGTDCQETDAVLAAESFYY